MRLSPSRTRLRTFVHYSIAFCGRPEATRRHIRRFVRLTGPDKYAKFRDPRLNSSPEILPEVIGGGIFDRFLQLLKLPTGRSQ